MDPQHLVYSIQNPSRARSGFRERLALALRLDDLAWAVTAVKNFGLLAHAEGQTEQALMLLGLARNHPAWASDIQLETETYFAEWALDPHEVEVWLKKGAELDWEETIHELLKG